MKGSVALIKGILFDLDGTLLNTNELIYKSFVHMFKEVLNKELKKDEITSLYGKPLEVSLNKYSKDEKIIQNMIRTYRKYNIDNHDRMCRTFEGIPELLRLLKEKKIKCGIVTSKKKDVAERGLQITDILKFMDVIITPEDTEKHKPEGEPALRACEILKLKPEEVMMVGDSPYDLLCGKNAGCLTCGVEYTEIALDLLKKVNPDYMIEKPLDLLKII